MKDITGTWVNLDMNFGVGLKTLAFACRSKPGQRLFRLLREAGNSEIETMAKVAQQLLREYRPELADGQVYAIRSNNHSFTVCIEVAHPSFPRVPGFETPPVEMLEKCGVCDRAYPFPRWDTPAYSRQLPNGTLVQVCSLSCVERVIPPSAIDQELAVMENAWKEAWKEVLKPTKPSTIRMTMILNPDQTTCPSCQLPLLNNGNLSYNGLWYCCPECVQTAKAKG